jgi:GR25 family glycosyltransferase involved in LPS biosynthesis
MNLENSNTKCFIIHLKRAPKRKSFVDDIIKNVPIDSEIINAVDGKILSKKDIDNILSYNKIYNPKYPFKINSGEIGCFLSKIKKKCKIIELDNELELLQPLPTFLRTSAQLVSYEAAVELLNKTTKIDRPVDTTLQIFWKTNIICYCINPSGISDHTFEAGGSTLSKKTSSGLRMSKNIKRLIYRTIIFCLSKYKKIKET